PDRARQGRRLSALINTTPIVAMLIPAVKELQQTRGIPARQVLLPVAHATTLAGSVDVGRHQLQPADRRHCAVFSGVNVSMYSFAIIAPYLWLWLAGPGS
ncbi:MAG: hypothetical protein V9E82_02975, partial [Candidatus Nanopelagicales bacterium]